jgi:hypothetical protein
VIITKKDIALFSPVYRFKQTEYLMKKLTAILLLTIVVTLLSSTTNGQNFNQYKASNGITYRVGDTVILESKSAAIGNLIYLVEIKKMKVYRREGQKRMYFRVKGGDIKSHNLDIEDAILKNQVTFARRK